jgi:hypothetical protein
MATESPETTLVVATVNDADRAREAVDTLMSSAPQRDDLDIVLYTSRGESLVLVAAKSAQAERWAILATGHVPGAL